MTLKQLRRVRWAVRATLALGGAASITANVLHAQPGLIPGVIAAWPPLALLVTLELISRVPVHRRPLAVVRWIATAAIAGIAAWVSYGHMAAVVYRYGERGATPYLLPLSVDGLIVVASVCLVELAGRIRADVDVINPSPADAESRDVVTTSDATDLPEPAVSDMTDNAPKTRKPRSDNAATRVAKLRAKRPDISQADAARRLKISPRTVARHWPATQPDMSEDTQPVNGAEVHADLLTTTSEGR